MVTQAGPATLQAVRPIRLGAMDSRLRGNDVDKMRE